MFRGFKYFSKCLSTFNLSNIQCRLFQTKSISSLLDLDLNESSSSSTTNDNIIRVIGWVKSYRDQKQIKFIHLNDGSDERHLQLVLLKENFANAQVYDDTSTRSLTFNTSIEVFGRLVASSNPLKQRVELHVTDLKTIGECDPLTYPFQTKKSYTMEQMRQHLHLRTHLNAFR
jgi:asparaginyl-tRNA synthetase